MKVVEQQHQSLQKKIVVGKGLVTTVVAMVQDKDSQKYKALRILLDSGSDGDLLFVQEGTRNIVPTKRRISSQKSRTSSGTFKTTKVGELDLRFIEFSQSKVASFRADIVAIP